MRLKAVWLELQYCCAFLLISRVSDKSERRSGWLWTAAHYLGWRCPSELRDRNQSNDPIPVWSRVERWVQTVWLGDGIGLSKVLITHLFPVTCSWCLKRVISCQKLIELLLLKKEIKKLKSCYLLRVDGGVVVNAVASQQEVSRFISQLGPFCAEFACSPCASVDFLWGLWFPPFQSHAL